MAPLDTGSLLATISEDAPAGPNLEFDAEFSALERGAQGKPEQQYGDTIIPAEEPDWKDVEARAAALLTRTRDLRVLSQLAVARLHLGGLPAFAEILALTQQLLEARWDEVHPQLDPEEDNDPTLRGNALLRLAHPGLVLRYLRGMPLASSPRLGQYSWRDVGVATGTLESDAADKPSEAVIRSAFQDSDPARLEALRNAAIAAGAASAAIPAAFDQRSAFGTGPDLGELIKLLGEIAKVIERYAVFATPADAAAETPAAAEPGTVAARAPGGTTAASITEVTTRADAVRLLELVSRYYQRYEPASPLSLLIERARGLAEKNFLEIVRELAPDGLAQAQNVVGVRNEQAGGA